MVVVDVEGAIVVVVAGGVGVVIPRICVAWDKSPETLSAWCAAERICERSPWLSKLKS